MQRIEKTFAGPQARHRDRPHGEAGRRIRLVTVRRHDGPRRRHGQRQAEPAPVLPAPGRVPEKTYAAGKIPGGFIKREGRPHDDEILAARIIDRSIRPLFPEGFKNEVQVFIYVISADQENDADVLALVAASFALNASKIPFAGPIAGVRVGRIQGNWVLNPTFQQLEYSDMELVVAGIERLDHDGRGRRARGQRRRRASRRSPSRRRASAS